MSKFTDYYRKLYETFGYPLTKQSGISTATLDKAEKQLGVKIPIALRDYYLVAGCEPRFSACHNRLLSPSAWSVEKQRLVFMEENQSVCYWGVSVRNRDTDDPPVSQGVEEDEMVWYPEHRKCSVFLAVMLHYQAVSGGLPYCGSANAPDQSDYRFEKNGWTHYGEVNSLQAYSRSNQVVCLMPPGDLPFMQKWSILAGAETKDDLQVIANDLGVTLGD
jgi:hypothetical protein